RVNTDLANDLGNLLSRALKMIEDYCGGTIPAPDPSFRDDEPLKDAAREAWSGLVTAFEELDFSTGLTRGWSFVGLLNPFTRPPATAAAPGAGAPAEVGIEEFGRIDLRTARVVAAERVPGADRLLKLTVDIGSETRTIVAGIAARYPPESLVGKTIVVVANLKPAKLRGVVSQGMLLAASDASGQPYILTTEEPVPPGWKVK